MPCFQRVTDASPFMDSRAAARKKKPSRWFAANETLGFAADARDYEFSAQILKMLSATKIRLLSNNPEKVRQLESAGIRVVERVPCQPRISKISRAYLKTKKRKMGHLLEGV